MLSSERKPIRAEESTASDRCFSNSCDSKALLRSLLASPFGRSAERT
ncbi:hypothetical protein [Scytonema hofmannii]|nr:hypothetical protein [Scytonema hofmannii]